MASEKAPAVSGHWEQHTGAAHAMLVSVMRKRHLSTLSLSGVFVFFIVYALGLLLVLLVIAIMRLYYAGYVPKVLLIANAHSVPVSKIIQRVVSRRQPPRHPAFRAHSYSFLPWSLPAHACCRAGPDPRPALCTWPQCGRLQTSSRPLASSRHRALESGRGRGDRQISCGSWCRTTTAGHTPRGVARCHGLCGRAAHRGYLPSSHVLRPS